MAKASSSKKILSKADQDSLINTLRSRFEKYKARHKEIGWSKVEERLIKHTDKLWSLHEMERTGGEPDVVGHDKKSGEVTFFDCAAESPSGRRSLCFDDAALEARKEAKPAGSAMNMAAQMKIELLTEEEYRYLQQLGDFDLKTSSWVQTPSDIRKAGGSLFCDRRYGHVFLYHNGAQSYYAARAFRGKLII